METYYLKYNREVKTSLNRLNNLHREGVLLRKGDRLFDYMPWVEFGDLGLEPFLTVLKTGALPPFVVETFEMDQNQLSPVSFLNHDLEGMSGKSEIIKLKFRGSVENLFREIEKAPNKVRLDFNQGLSLHEWKVIEGDLQKKFRSKIDFIEDPTAIGDLKSDLPLAADFNAANSQTTIKIFKPMREKYRKFDRVIFTHNMGHAVGQILSYLHLCRYPEFHTEHHGLLMPEYYKDHCEVFVEHNDRWSLDDKIWHEIRNKLEGEKWIKLA